MHTSKKGKGHPPRLQSWDYSWVGAYFVTFVVKGQMCCLSRIENSKLQLSSWGEIVQRCWLELSNQFQSVILDEMVIMPNHVHAVVFLTGAGGTFMNESPKRALINQGPTNQGPTLKPMMTDPRIVLGKVVRAWKAKSARLIHETGNPSFSWQSRYYEHIIRNESELERVRTYIVNNPNQWGRDDENPNR